MRWKWSLASQFLLFQLGIVVLVVTSVAAVSLAQTDATFRRDQGRRMQSVAEAVAANASVRHILANAGKGILPDAEALAASAAQARTVYDVSYVQIADADGTLLAGPDAGRSAVLGPSRVLSGVSWIGVVDDGARALVAHAPVLDEADGAVVGLVAVGRAYPTRTEQLAAATSDLLVYLVLGGLLGVAGSLLLARRVKRQTLGLEPREIVGLVEHREAMLHGIKEGVVGTDSADRITLANDEAVRLLGLPDDAVGRSLHSPGMPPRLLDILTGAATTDDQVELRDDRVLVLNRKPVLVRGRQVGSVTTLRDRTELTALQRELDVSRHATDTLRAQAHEFSNRLHTIAGLIELGEHEEVVHYINRANQARDELTHTVMSRIADPSVAALVIAKASLAAEQDAELRVSPECDMGPVSEELSADLVTVVGNLIDNALDAVDAGGWVEVEVRTTEEEVIVVVRDSGAGVAPELVDTIFRQGYTTKASAEGHQGFGLALIWLICHRGGGTIGVEGSTFTARIPLAAGAPR